MNQYAAHTALGNTERAKIMGWIVDWLGAGTWKTVENGLYKNWKPEGVARGNTTYYTDTEVNSGTIGAFTPGILNGINFKCSYNNPALYDDSTKTHMPHRDMSKGNFMSFITHGYGGGAWWGGGGNGNEVYTSRASWDGNSAPYWGSGGGGGSGFQWYSGHFGSDVTNKSTYYIPFLGWPIGADKDTAAEWIYQCYTNLGLNTTSWGNSKADILKNYGFSWYLCGRDRGGTDGAPGTCIIQYDGRWGDTISI